ncbi:hypothetical protein CB1_001575001, partial [Camelus ferus]
VGLPEDTVKRCVQHLGLALDFMHRDIKLENRYCYLAELQSDFLGYGYHLRRPLRTGAFPPVTPLLAGESILTTTQATKKHQEASSAAEGEEQEQEKKRSFESRVGKLPDKGSFHQPSRQDPSGESSKDAQKVGFQLSQDLGQGLGHILGEVPEDLSRSSGSSRVKFYGVNSEESESDLRLLRNDSGIDLLRRLDKNLENILKGPLGKNLGQINRQVVFLTLVCQGALAWPAAGLASTHCGNQRSPSSPWNLQSGLSTDTWY